MNIKHKLQNESGQAFPYFFMMSVVLIMCWMMLINLGKLTKDRMMMQNAADNAALSVATYRARVLNKVGQFNYMIATALYGTKFGVGAYHKYGVTLSVEGAPAGLPVPIWPMGGLIPGYDPPGPFAVDNQKKIGGVADLAKKGGGKAYVSSIRNLVKGFITAQDSFRLPYPGLAVVYANKIAQRQEINAAGDATGADNAVPMQGLTLGLQRNDSGVEYFETKAMKGLAATIAKAAVKLLLSAAGVPGEIQDIYKAESWEKEDKSWMYVEKDTFNKHNKIIVVATKGGGSASNKGYPFGGWFFNLSDWPSIQTVAAAGVYNMEGPMFVFEKNDKISPVIKAYADAEKGGWHAHLVPVAQMGVQH